MFMCIKVEHPNGYTGVLYGKSSMSIYDEKGHECFHTIHSRIKNEAELCELLEDMPRLMKSLSKLERKD